MGAQCVCVCVCVCVCGCVVSGCVCVYVSVWCVWMFEWVHSVCVCVCVCVRVCSGMGCACGVCVGVECIHTCILVNIIIHPNSWVQGLLSAHTSDGRVSSTRMLGPVLSGPKAQMDRAASKSQSYLL